MIPTLTALATIFVLSQQLPTVLQAAMPGTQEEITQAAEDIPVTAVAPPEVTPRVEINDAAETDTGPVEDVPLTLEEELALEAEAGSLPPADAALDAGAVQPAPIEAESLSAEMQTRLLEQARGALTTTRTAKGNFTQANADGSLMTGAFALQRPGKVRFDYDDPTPILIVSDGTTVAMEDSELETVDRIPLGSTPLGLILDDGLDFSDPDIEIVSVSEDYGLAGITVRDATGEVDGELTLLFETEQFEFLGWIATDSELNTTQVSLSDVTTNNRLDPRLFRLDDPRDEEDKR